MADRSDCNVMPQMNSCEQELVTRTEKGHEPSVQIESSSSVIYDHDY